MKTFTAALVFVMMVFIGGRMVGQNLVGNGSFEEYSSCPDHVSQIAYSTGWMSFQQSPDYFNVCATDSVVGVPNNWVGFQDPYEGSAYAGIISWWQAYPDMREFLARELTEPLETGSTYFVSFRTNLAVAYAQSIAINHMGAKFTNTLYNSLTPLWVDNNPAIDYPYFITDTVNWITISGFFVADSDYHYLAIGNFFDAQHTDTMYMSNYSNHQQAYYYIDSVSVSCIDCPTSIESSNVQLSFTLSPNPFTTHLQLHYMLTQPGELMVYDALGRKVKSYTLAASEKTFELSVAELPAGVYLVAVNSGGRVWGEVVVKE